MIIHKYKWQIFKTSAKLVKLRVPHSVVYGWTAVAVYHIMMILAVSLFNETNLWNYRVKVI